MATSFGTAFCLFCCSVITACTSPQLRGSTANFGEATHIAASAQTERLNKLTALQIDSIRGNLASERVILAYSQGCAELINPGTPQGDCRVVRRDGKPIPEAATFPSILALNKALADYGKNLALLAQDSSKDNAAFNKSLLDLVASVEDLGAAIGLTDSAKDSNSSNSLAAVTGVTQLSGVLSAAVRAGKLREIIIASDPSVQQAALLLSQASKAIGLLEITIVVETTDRTQIELQRAISSGAKKQTVAKLQSELFKNVENIKRIHQLKDTYDVIGKSHSELAKAAQSRASSEELRATIVELLEIVTALQNSGS